ncbi:hypothetical protein [Lewinella sp. JB7]|uniref:hypothetical protein n=1 Tax=Lewinella sp. JB7 TaxID=2962887 RepID=UPI0020C9A394|nr:hypothetical protein [Lewinella sp. JB7]MCP9236385.1 hypothetical protein [Lewinella sp. JB7]
MGKSIGDRTFRWVSAGAGIVVIVLSILAVLYPDDLRGVDTNVIHTLQRLLVDNGNLYLDPERPPFSITQYGPLYYITGDVLLSLLGFDPSSVYGLLVVMRVLSSGMFVFGLDQFRRLLRHDLGCSRKTAGLLCGLVVVYTYPWYFMARPDVLVFVFLLLFLRVFLRETLTTGRSSALLALVVCAGCLSKQNFVVFGCLAGLYFIRRAAYRQMALYVATGITATLLFLGVAWGCGYSMTFLWENVVDGVDNGIDVKSTVERIYFAVVAYHGPLIGITVLLGIRLGSDRLGSRGRKLIFLMVGTLIFSLITGLKHGSAINYLNEFVVILLVGLGYLLSLIERNLRRTFQWILLLLGVQMLAFAGYRYGPRIAAHTLSLVHGAPLSIDVDRRRLVHYLVDQRPFDHVYVADNMVALSFPGEIILFQEDIHRLTYRRGVYDYHHLYEMIQHHELDYLVLEHEETEFFGIDVAEYFERDRQFGLFTIYKKRVN